MVRTKERASVAFLNLGHAYDHFFMLIYPTVVLALGREFSQTYDALLALATAGFIAFGAAALPAGWLGDRWSRRGMMTVFFIGTGLSSILTGMARSPMEVALGLGCLGLFAAIYHPVGIALLVQGTDKMGKTLGINGVFGNLGVAVAGISAGALTDWLNWRAAFIVPGCLAVITGVAYGLVMRGLPLSSGAGRPQHTAMQITARLQMRVFAVLIIAAVFGGLVFNGMTVALPKVFEERLSGLATTTFGIGSLVTLVFGVAALAQILVGYWLDRYAFKWVLVALTVAQIPLLLMVRTAEDLVMLMTAAPLMFFIFGEIPINDWVVARYTPECWRSRVYALKYVLSLGVSSLAVPLVAIFHGAAGGFQTLFLIMAGCVAVIPLAASILLPTALTKPVRPLEPIPQPAQVGD
jgi:MFS family permease